MTKHHQSKAEQIDNKELGTEPFHHEKIQVRAYHIYQEKGRSDLDNWLEAERTIRNIH
jgi:hypothetical protein